MYASNLFGTQCACNVALRAPPHAPFDMNTDDLAPAYNEDADGFSFKRGGRGRGRLPKVRPQLEPAASEPASSSAPNTYQTSTDNAAAPRRRSARTSKNNEKENEKSNDAPQTTIDAPADSQDQRTKPERKPRASQDKVRLTPKPSAEPIKVDKKRDTMRIALPFADTPVIDRNRQMRDFSNQGRRRSSGGMRGRRASSLMESGTSNGMLPEDLPRDGQQAHPLNAAIPHAEVRTEEFYKHISPDLPEPRRMKLLLSWCGTRALPGKPPRTSENFSALAAGESEVQLQSRPPAQDLHSTARMIEDELLKDFANKSEMSDWFNRVCRSSSLCELRSSLTWLQEDVRTEVLVKKPNPRNQQNASKLLELEQEVKRLEKEKTAWQTHLSRLSASMQSQQTESSMQQRGLLRPADIDEQLLDDERQQECLHMLRAMSASTADMSDRLRNACSVVEFKVDHFYHGVHHMQRFAGAVEEIADTVLSKAQSALDAREREALQRSGMESVGVADLLRGIGKSKAS